MKKYNKFANLFHYTFTLDLTNKIPVPPTCVEKIEFPTHPLKAKRVLNVASFGSPNPLNLEMQARLQDSHEQIVKIGGIEFSNFTGTIYLVWANVTRKNVNGVPAKQDEPQPVLFFKDGHNKFQSIVFIFHENLEVDISDCTVVDVCTLWCLERAKQKKTRRFKVVDSEVKN